MPEVGVYPASEINAFATGPANGTLIAFSSNLVNIMNKRKENEEASAGQIIRKFFLVILFHIITAIFRLIGIMVILWYNRKREYAADLKGAEIIGVNDMLSTLRKLLALENKSWVVDGIDLTEDENVQGGEPNSISLLKFNPEKKKRGLLDLFRTHPTLEDRIERLEKLKSKKNNVGVV
ncbi:1320_t:CDS:2 [Funneliformis geosporum]|uniref:1320_t:CDS:1 n=1 Tax=Funneliformis geosporum TaxID=1117311 RepID=A0A9W4WP96_9GLOM|nr:1320_t:CDS:2 [Funneliformis geosporum]